MKKRENHSKKRKKGNTGLEGGVDDAWCEAIR